jgi:hypothetical protein
MYAQRMPYTYHRETKQQTQTHSPTNWKRILSDGAELITKDSISNNATSSIKNCNHPKDL